jgi:hypothetical protein
VTLLGPARPPTPRPAPTVLLSVLLEPQAIYPENVKDVVADGFTTVPPSSAPPTELKAKCAEFGVMKYPRSAVGRD